MQNFHGQTSRKSVFIKIHTFTGLNNELELNIANGETEKKS
jgi:hypothetical protein